MIIEGKPKSNGEEGKDVKNFLITGSSGFVGTYFIELLNGIKEKVNIFCVDITENGFNAKSFNNGRIEFSKVDLLNNNKVKEIILKFHPDYILHLASFSSVAFSWSNPVLGFNNNTNIFLNLIEAVRETGIKCRILSVGSSEEYGRVKEADIPICESVTVNPISPYAVARVSQELLSKVYVSGYGLDIVMTRSFNHFGPLQKEIFAIPSFVKQIVKIKKEGKSKGVLRVGDVDIVRDFLDVRDVVKAYYLLMLNGRTGGIYNVCGGKGISLRKIIQCIANYLKIKVELTIEQSLVRPNDNPIILGKNEKIREELGWSPEISLEKSIADICDYWMNK